MRLTHSLYATSAAAALIASAQPCAAQSVAIGQSSAATPNDNNQAANTPAAGDQSSVGPSRTGADVDAEAAQTAQGDTPATQGRARVEERGDVVVTGNRFQRILSQPQSKSVIDAEQRNLSGIGNIRTVIDVQPGINYTETFGLNVRGVGRQTPQTLLGQENAVLQYVDGFLNLVPSNIAESTLFGGNIQFLRGPSGTTYGRNALGGAVNLISRAPTKEFTGEVEAGGGRAGYVDVGANISGPITSNLGFRVGLQEFINPTIQKNLGTTLDSKNAGFAVKNRYLELQLEWRIGGFHIRNRTTTFEYDNQPNYPSLTQYQTAGVFGGLAPNPQFAYAGPVPSQPYQINVNFAGYDRLRNNFQEIVNADLDLGFATLVYVGGYQQFHSSGSSDLDFTSRTSYNAATVAPGVFAPGTQVPTDYRANYDNNDRFWSQEARLEGKPGGRIGWVLGTYYFNQHFNEYYNNNIANATTVLTTPQVSVTNSALGTPNPNSATFEQKNIFNVHSIAGFGNITYDLTKTIQFDGGLRYTWDEKDATNNFRYVFYYPPFFAADVSPAVHSANPRRHDRGLSGRAAIAWRPSAGNQLYASYSRGYQSSAFTLGQGLPPNNIAKSEHLDVYEIGGNATLNRVRFDGSVFYQNFFDQQIPVFRQLITPTTLPNGTSSNIVSTFTSFLNAPKSEIYGAELQATWRPTDHANIVASYTYLHPTFTNFSGVVDITQPATINGAANPRYQMPQNLAGSDIPRTPRNKATLYGYYGISLGNAGYLYPGGSVAYQSSFYTQPFNTDQFRVGGRAIVGLTLTYRSPNEHLDITGSVLNAFRRYYTDNGNVQIVGTTVQNITTYGQDRYWTVTARYRF